MFLGFQHSAGLRGLSWGYASHTSKWAFSTETGSEVGLRIGDAASLANGVHEIRGLSDV